MLTGLTLDLSFKHLFPSRRHNRIKHFLKFQNPIQKLGTGSEFCSAPLLAILKHSVFSAAVKMSTPISFPLKAVDFFVPIHLT